MAKKNQQLAAGRMEYVADELNRVRRSRSSWISLEESGLTEIPDELFQLIELESINLRNNNFKTVPERLWELPKLRKVTLVGNPIEVLPNRPGLLIDLPTYKRCRDQVEAKNVILFIRPDASPGDVAFVRNELSDLRGLGGLFIGGLFIHIGESHPDPNPEVQQILGLIGNFEALESLSIRGIRLLAAPEGVRNLHRLKYVNFDALALESLPDWIGKLDLEELSVADNRLHGLPNSIHELKSLKLLDLSWNPISQLPASVFQLTSLETLMLRKCAVKEITADILSLRRLKLLVIERNPIESPPEEVAEKGLDAIRDYWRQRADTGVDYLCEAKLIILGEAGAGKTSLARKIQNPEYQLRKDEKSTEGIEVIHYEFPSAIRARENGTEKVIQRQFQVNIWDFGGQEIYHATHQFFLTRRSVYVLVCDDRKEDTDFSYWLQVVEMLSDASPLLIVQNEKQDRTRDINLSSLRARYANLSQAIATNLDTNRGLDCVIQAIRKELETLPHVGVGLPASWKRVREALEQDDRDYISLEEYLVICEKYGFTRREDKLQLSGYLHDLGICLHFQDDPLLNKTVVLKPSWGTAAVYRVLDDPEIVANHGRFTRQELDRIWSEEKYAGMQNELLQLMMKFQLCYALDLDRGYIAPQLLSSEQPPYPWEPTSGLVVRYEYGFLPKGIITRFIVAMHRLIAGGKLVWKTGVVLERDGTRAEIIEQYSERRIRVRVDGADPRGLLSIVDEQLERLHTSFPRLQYERFLPCPCAECGNKADPYGFPLNKLIKMAIKRQQIQCHESGEMVEAGRLVESVLPGAVLRGIAPPGCSPSEPIQAISLPATPEVFVSYAWTAASNAIVARVQQALEEHGIRLLRDREEVRYKDSIRDFMRRIGQAKAVVVVISEKYLKSENCMFELLEVAKAQSLRERVFPIVLADANIYKAVGRVEYVRHWEDEIQKLDAALKGVRGDNLTNLQEDLNIYAEIRQLFDGITNTLRDMNALTPDQHEGSGFDELIRRIRAQLGVSARPDQGRTPGF
jgi:internalin A